MPEDMFDALFSSIPTAKEEFRVASLQEEKEILDMCMEYKYVDIEGPRNLFVSVKYRIHDVRKMKIDTYAEITIPRLEGRRAKVGKDKRSLLGEGVNREVIREKILSYGNMVHHVKIQDGIKVDKKTKKVFDHPTIKVSLVFNSKIEAKSLTKYYKVFRNLVKELK